MFAPLQCRVSYHLADDPRQRAYAARVDLSSLPLFTGEEGTEGQVRKTIMHAEDFDLLLETSPCSLLLMLLPKQDLFLEGCSLEFLHPFSTDEKVLLNGFQSWTGTQERDPFARMKGMKWVPRWLKAFLALDTAGDYRFYDYVQRAGDQHGWTYAYARDDKACALLASLDESRGFTCLEIDARRGIWRATTERPRGLVAQGSCRILSHLAFAVAPAVEQAHARWLDLAGASPRSHGPFWGYTSKAPKGGLLSAATLIQDLESVLELSDALKTQGFRRVFQIGRGYTEVGDWLKVDEDRFPLGMQDPIQEIQAADFIPGLWMAPLLCAKGSDLVRLHPDWLLQDDKGKPLLATSSWGGAFALDICNQQVQDHLRQVLGQMVDGWGLGFLTLDHLYAACLKPREDMNRGQLMAFCMDLFREAVGEDVVISAAGIPLGSALGKADICQVSCLPAPEEEDGFIQGLLQPLCRLSREQPSLENGLSTCQGRAPLNGLAFFNDPGSLAVHSRDEQDQERCARMLLNASEHGGLMMVEGDLGSWSEGDRMRLQAALFAMARGSQAATGQDSEDLFEEDPEDPA